MKTSVMLALVIAVVAVEFACGQEPQQPNEHLKGFAPFIGTWRYEGPALEESPLADKDSKVVFQISWRWILDKQAVMADWSFEFESGAKISGKLLNGWNAEKEKIVSGGMDSTGGMGMATYVLDSEAQTITETVRGVTGEGEEWSNKNLMTKPDKDTVTWQALERNYPGLEGPSPIFKLKRVKRAAGKKAAN